MPRTTHRVTFERWLEKTIEPFGEIRRHRTEHGYDVPAWDLGWMAWKAATEVAQNREADRRAKALRRAEGKTRE